ncbi:MAG: hypothetical protein AVDCRST_MAG14-771 [uncultured Rubrobacteraceae bacterium]|uniref:Chromosome partition protein smc n=1 Tax=uncultured Rubrobacteraceae bacterium TaxID=349277 RepID=A0A6J4QN34_9ACTN|nr:MAG: hypothetical protein AVDCRST_MAG14-771 [uncultured Rubrobacteraceae bacterium]
MSRKKTLEEKVAAAIGAEFVSVVARLEEERQEYRRRWVLKEKARVGLEDAEAEVRRLHSERISLGRRFWEAYYEKDEVLLSEVETESGTLIRTIEMAEKTLKKAHADFEEADFDKAAEGSRLREKAGAAQGEAERRITALEEALGDALARARRNVEEASQALQDELEAPRLDAVAEERNVREENAAMHRTANPQHPWWLRWLNV